MKYFLSLFVTLFLALNVFSQETIDIDVESWLSERQDIGASIVWINRGNPISYNDWPSALKDDLQTAVYGLLNNQNPFGLSGVPDLVIFDYDRYGIVDRTAWIYYVSYVAQSITAEIKKLIPWSLDELNLTSLSVLFDSREMLTYYTSFDVYQFKYVTPGSPEYVYKFLEDNALIGQTRTETISRILEWCKNLTHYSYSPGDDQNSAYYATWQYYGEPPVKRTIEGTVRTPPGNQGLKHFTRGCHGTVQFIRTLLQTLNIPTKYERIEGHAIPHFVHEDLYMSHGDDPYGGCMKCNDVVIPAEELLFGNSEYQSRFGSQLSPEERLKNIGFKPTILAVQYLSLCLLNKRCEANAMGYNNQECYTYMADYMDIDNEYTFEELNNMNFWNLLDNKINNYGGCGNNSNFSDYCSRTPIPSSNKSILNFWFYGQYGTSVINTNTRTINAQIIGSYDIRYVIPHFCLSEKASINCNSGSYIDFTSPRTFQVTAENGTQNSWTVNLTQVNSNSPPNKPQLLTPGNGTSWSTPFNLSWQCTDPDPGDVINYTLRLRRKGVTNWMVFDVGTQTSQAMSNWIHSELGTYEWSVIANDGEAQSTSDIREFTLLNSPPNEPQLMNPDDGTSWSTTFNLRWQCTDPNVGDILNYTVRVRPQGTTNWNSISVGTQTSYTVSGWSASDAGTWEWSIVASDGEAQSMSDIREFTLIYLTLSATPSSIQVASASGSTGSINVVSIISWTVTDDVTWLNLSRTSGTGNGTVTVTTTSANTSTSSRSANVTFSASGVNSVTVVVTQGGISNSPPNPPQLLNPGDGTSWSTPFNMSWQGTDPDDDALNYTVRIRRKGSTTWITNNVGTQTSHTLSGWTDSDLGTYEWYVLASDGEFERPSLTWEFTLVAANNPPNPPQLLTPGDGTSWSSPFNLTWQCSDPDPGDILNYTVSVRPKGTTTWNRISVGTQTSYSVSGWSSSDLGTYEWYILASDGETERPSLTWEFTLVAANNPPNPPQLLTPGNGTSWSSPFNLTWQCSDPDPGDILNYIVRARPKGTTAWYSESVGTQTSYNISGWSTSGLGTYEWSIVVSDGKAQTVSDIWEFTLTTPTLTVTPSNQNVLSSSGAVSFDVLSNISWAATSNQAWCTVTPPGTGNGTITATYQANTGSSTRTATITVTGSGVSNQTVTVTQTGTTPTLTVTPSNQNVLSSSGAVSFDVLSNISWAATSNQAWCTVTPSGTGNGIITATFQENTGTTSRTATITISGSDVSNQTVTLSQSVPIPTPTLTVTPSNQNVLSSSGTVSFDVLSNISWTATSNQAWCTVTPSGTGNGTITAIYQANTGSSAAIATITVSGQGVNNQTVTVTRTCTSPEQPGLIDGKSKIIKNSTETYSIQPVLGAASYTWVLPTGWSGNSTSTSILITTSEDAISGNITVVANNDCGSSVPSSLYVEVGECVIPQITLKWDDVLICSNIENIFLSYQWFNGTMPIPGANDQYYVTSKQPGVYKVETIDKNGCREMSNEITITGSKSLSIYPNPAKSSFTVSIIDQPVGKVNLRIINSTGRKIMDIETDKPDIEFLKELPADDLDEGFYIIQVIVNQAYLYNSKILIIK